MYLNSINIQCCNHCNINSPLLREALQKGVFLPMFWHVLVRTSNFCSKKEEFRELFLHHDTLCSCRTVYSKYMCWLVCSAENFYVFCTICIYFSFVYNWTIGCVKNCIVMKKIACLGRDAHAWPSEWSQLNLHEQRRTPYQGMSRRKGSSHRNKRDRRRIY